MKTFTIKLKEHVAAGMHQVREQYENVADIDFYGDEVQVYFEEGGDATFKIRENETMEVKKQ